MHKAHRSYANVKLATLSTVELAWAEGPLFLLKSEQLRSLAPEFSTSLVTKVREENAPKRRAVGEKPVVTCVIIHIRLRNASADVTDRVTRATHVKPSGVVGENIRLYRLSVDAAREKEQSIFSTETFFLFYFLKHLP